MFSSKTSSKSAGGRGGDRRNGSGKGSGGGGGGGGGGGDSDFILEEVATNGITYEDMLGLIDSVLGESGYYDVKATR